MLLWWKCHCTKLFMMLLFDKLSSIYWYWFWVNKHTCTSINIYSLKYLTTILLRSNVANNHVSLVMFLLTQWLTLIGAFACSASVLALLRLSINSSWSLLSRGVVSGVDTDVLTGGASCGGGGAGMWLFFFLFLRSSGFLVSRRFSSHTPVGLLKIIIVIVLMPQCRVNGFACIA